MKPEVEQSSYWYVLQPSWCQFSATALTRKSPWQISVVPLPSRPPSCSFWGLSSSASHLSGYQRGNTPAPSRSGSVVVQGCYFTWLHKTSSAKTGISAVSLCVSDPSPFLTVFIFHNDADKLKGSEHTLKQISPLSSEQPSKEPMKLKHALILNGFS